MESIKGLRGGYPMLPGARGPRGYAGPTGATGADGSGGVFAAARIATGTPDGTKFLRDDQVWATPPAGGAAPVLYNAAVAAQGPGFAADTYLVGSSITVPTSRLQAKSMYLVRFNVVKTAAGIATPIVNIRFGTNGSTADTSRGTLTWSAQTAAVDEGVFEVFCTFRVVGASAVLQSLGALRHRLSITGLGVGVSEPEIATSATFDSTVANSIIGISVNGGTSAAWTVSVVQAELFNLV